MSSDRTEGTSAPPDVTDAIAQAVLHTPGVHDLHAGAVGQVATYLPGRRISGVRAVDNGYDIHLVLDWGFPALATAEAVRAAVHDIVPGRVDVTVEDVAPAAQLPS